MVFNQIASDDISQSNRNFQSGHSAFGLDSGETE